MPAAGKRSERRRWSKRPISEELPLLLAARNVSLRAFSTQVGIDVGYMSKALRTTGGKRPTSELIERIAAALELAPDYFLEYRRERASEAFGDRLQRDPSFVDREYVRLVSRRADQ